MVTGPSISPENAFGVPDYFTVAGEKREMDIAPAMDGQLMTDVFSNLIEAAAVLGISDGDVAAAKDFLPQIRPQQIGSVGQILEWRYEYPEKVPGQKHLSPLYWLHPSWGFSPLVNETLAGAAQVLLDNRVAHGSGTTGWSRTWLVNQYARAFRGEDAWAQLTAWFGKYPLPNLWNTDSGSTFQIDGNFGFLSGVTEMLFQSGAGVLHLLPALPSALPSGQVQGWVGRGNFLVDIAWEGGRLTQANVTSRSGGEIQLMVAGGTTLSVNGNTYAGSMTTEKGSTYVVTLS